MTSSVVGDPGLVYYQAPSLCQIPTPETYSHGPLSSAYFSILWTQDSCCSSRRSIYLEAGGKKMKEGKLKKQKQTTGPRISKQKKASH